MKLIIEAFGKRMLVDLELTAPAQPESPSSPSAPSHDGHSTTASQVEQADDGVRGPFGFAPVIKAAGR